MKDIGSRFFQGAILAALVFLPLAKANAVSAACSSFSTSSFSNYGEVVIGTPNYATGPFLPGDYVTVGMSWIIPGIAGYVPHDSFSLVDANGNVLAGPSSDGLLHYQVQGTVPSIGVKNLGDDPDAIINFANCQAAPIFPTSAPALDKLGLIAFPILLVAVARLLWRNE